MNLDMLAHIANIFFLAAYLVKDILWLRLISIFGCLSLMIYYYAYPAEPLWTPIYWDGLFVIVNIFHIGLLIREKKDVALNDEEAALFDAMFKSLTPRQFLRLMQIASWRDVDEGATLTVQGKQSDSIMLIVTGRAEVSIDGKTVAKVSNGHFVGEVSFLTDVSATATVVTTEPVRLVEWHRSALESFLQHNLDVRTILQGIMAADLARKLKSMSSEAVA